MLESKPERKDNEEEEPLIITPDLADKLDETGEQVRKAFQGLSPDQIEDIKRGHSKKVMDKLKQDFKKRKTQK